MAVGFGFSMGDLVTGLQVIKDSIAAVKDGKGASAHYAALLTEIECLQDALEGIEGLRLDLNGSAKQRGAIDRAVAACRKCIDDFIASIAKYQPHLQLNTSGWVSNYRKIKWAVCRKDDVTEFRAQLERHASTIHMLLITFQSKARGTTEVAITSTTFEVREQRMETENRTAAMLKSLSLEQRQCFEFLMLQNKELMRSVQELNRILKVQTAVPPQVLLQKPVILLDAFGKIAPFHLDFIDSMECFTAVLKIRFRQAGVGKVGLSKLEHREFTIQETRHKRSVDLSKPWPTLFRPGQEVDMSMVFHRFACPPNTCPGCSRINENDDEQSECQSCGLWYQNIQAIKKLSDFGDQDVFHARSTPDRSNFQYVIQQPGMKPETRMFVPSTDVENDFFDNYRRVQVISQPITLFYTNQYPPQQLELFCQFVLLFTDSKPADVLPYMREMRRLRIRIKEHLKNSLAMPPFSSFFRVKQWQKEVAEEACRLCEDVDGLFITICNDNESGRLIDYLTRNARPNITLGYYPGLLAHSLRKKRLTESAEPAGSIDWFVKSCSRSENSNGKPKTPRTPRTAQSDKDSILLHGPRWQTAEVTERSAAQAMSGSDLLALHKTLQPFLQVAPSSSGKSSSIS